VSSILKTIVEYKKKEIAHLRTHGSFAPRSDTPRGFIKQLQSDAQIAVIAEVKKASPSKGLICSEFDPVTIAHRYEAGGARAVSVLTDEHFFQGSTAYLTQVRSTISLPVLRKEFIIDPLQVEETASLNADAMLLIAAILSDSQLQELYAATVEQGIDPLIEIHNHRELERVMKIEPALIGINNRDLNTFKTDIQTTIDLIREIPSQTTVVSESGIFTGTQTQKLATCGVTAVLVGESLMRHENPGSLIKELSGAD